MTMCKMIVTDSDVCKEKKKKKKKKEKQNDC